MQKDLYSCIEGWFDFEEVYERMVDTFVDKARFVEVEAGKEKVPLFS